MNIARSHNWVDQRSLALARAIADKLRRDPALLEVARENIRRWKVSLHPWPPALQEWESVLALGLETALATLTKDGPQGRRLRQSSPFAGVLTPQERNAIFEEYESLAA